MRPAAPLRLFLLALTVALAGSDGCSKPDWVIAFETTMAVEVPRVEQSLERLGQRIDALPADVDARLAARVRALEAVLRDIGDGLAVILADGRQQLDAALLARVRQLEGSILALTTEVDRVATGRATQVTLAVDDLLLDVQAAARQVLDAYAVQVQQVTWRGEVAVARVGQVKVQWLARLVGLGVIVLGLAGFSVAFIARRRDGPWIPQLITGLVLLTLGGALAGSSALSRAALGGDVVMGHRPCPGALAEAGRLLADAGGDPADRLTAAVQTMGGLLACQAMTGDRDVFDRARARAAGLRRLMGLDSDCVDDGECPRDRWCAPETGACRSGCRQDSGCPAGTICHPAGARCAPPCVDGECAAPARCSTDGRCRTLTPPPPRPPRRPTGWAELTVCRDVRCLQTVDSALSRRILRGLGGP